MDSYTDLGVCNWVSSSKGTFWGSNPANPATAITGGYFETGENASASYFFSGGLEDLDVNVNFAVDRWRSSGSTYNNGFILKHTDEVIGWRTRNVFYQEDFSVETVSFILRDQFLEARWDSSRKDNRGNFIVSSSLGRRNR